MLKHSTNFLLKYQTWSVEFVALVPATLLTATVEIALVDAVCLLKSTKLKFGILYFYFCIYTFRCCVGGSDNSYGQCCGEGCSLTWQQALGISTFLAAIVGLILFFI